VRARWVGRELIAVLHVECDANATVADAHVIAEAVEHEVAHRVPAVRLDVHMDPSTGSLTRAT
jgi:divalent metal cation (Fe/Co/Zn/Cd) transporter